MSSNFIRFLKEIWQSTLRWILMCLVLLFLLNVFFIQSFSVLYGSMMPTIYEDDILMVSKWSYGYSRASFPKWLIPIIPDMDRFFVFGTPKRGDVVVMNGKNDDNVYVKRVIGLPGDKVQLINGQVWINGQHVPQKSYEEIKNDPNKAYTYDPRLKLLPENIKSDKIKMEYMFTGVQYYIIDQGDTVLDNTDVLEVPDNSYFVMGDNRDNSLDSRIDDHKGGLGMIDFRQIIGKVLWLRRGILSLLQPSKWYNVFIRDDE